MKELSIRFLQAAADAAKTEIPASSKPNAPQTAASSKKSGTSAKKTVMHRLYNPNTGEHFYTSNSAEQALLVKAGWKAEGVGWHAPENSSMKNSQGILRF